MELATLHFDTYKVIKLLQEKGYSKEEAEGFIEAVQEIQLSGVSTKQDVQDLKIELKQDIQDLRKEIQDLRVSTKQDVHDLKTEIQNTKNEMLKFQIIQTIAIVGVMVALFQMFS